MNHRRYLPVMYSLLALAGPAATSMAQLPLLPPRSPSATPVDIAQAAPAAVPPVATPTVPAAPVDTATPAPLDPNTPAPIAPPPVITGGTGTTAPAPLAPPIDNAAGASGGNPGGARAREFQGDDTGQVLRLLARQAKINLIVSDQVVGTINMRLEDVTALQAIQVICQAKGYDLATTNGVYYVKTPAEKAAEPTQSDYYTFSYARAAQVVALLTSQLKSKGVAPQVDERTNTVFYQEAKSNVSEIRGFLARIDRPTRQVMIEARLVEVNSNPTQSYGINWGGVFGSAGSPKTVTYGATGIPSIKDQTFPFVTPGSTVNGVTGPPTVTQIPTGRRVVDTYPLTFGSNGQLVPQGFALDGALNNLGNIFGGALGQASILSVPQFSATLRLLNEDADAEFLANPRIVTADNLEATIKIVRNQPVPQLNFNEQTAQAVFSGFQDKIYGSTLLVKPSINKDDFVTLSVKPEISNRVGDQSFAFQGATVTSPIIDTRSMEANVLIKSGCTLAIGGLLQDQTNRATTKVPILGDVPVLGYLFQEHLNTRSKRNLLIFVTPTIVSQKYGTGLEDQVTGLKNISKNEYADINGWRNNANGAIRLVKTPTKQVASQYPAPGDCGPDSKEKVSFKENASTRGN